MTLVLLSASALWLTACGDDSSDADGEAAVAEAGPLTKAEFIKRADEICKKADDRQYFRAAGYREDHAKELSKLAPVPREEKMIRIFVLPAIETQIEEIEALGVPEGDEAKIERILTEMKKGVKVAEKDPYSVSYEVPSAYPFRKLSELAGEYGFSECTNPT